MRKKEYHVLGVMSGTSLDGIDLAECYFGISDTNQWQFRFGETTTIPYSDDWKQRLSEGVNLEEHDLQRLDVDYTAYLGETISTFIKRHAISNLEAVCSHGHTILHQPDKGVTLQIGNLPSLSETLDQTVVCDFRVGDVALGGQGAPLVPIGDKLLFAEYDYCLNLGGFANCSFDKEGRRIAYDICPVNIVLNKLAEKLGQPYDDQGKLASEGKVDDSLLKKLNDLVFYGETAPKSLGLEWVNEYIWPFLKDSDSSVYDKLATFTQHIAQQLARQFEENASVFITGGGAYNEYLISLLGKEKKLRIHIPDATLLEFKEALVFGLLGVLRLREEVNCLSSVTGAKYDHTSGRVFLR
ncbi:anhydro-N-acetylmuramic acid kinase [Luteirhabdus pelagi]|uniref:anhydro-N-acetylmuramic acid kinase n=1 Tax=Luteirhabdus pelagi TaxID=2792783 RepID=UPI00193AD398|nr:anhydro-N-acetylmuramic acid kinase [Luteirhabdus pelagi]